MTNSVKKQPKKKFDGERGQRSSTALKIARAPILLAEYLRRSEERLNELTRRLERLEDAHEEQLRGYPGYD